MRLRIESDGTIGGTRVVNAETGEKVEGVRAITWEWEQGYPAHVSISLDDAGASLALTLDDRSAPVHNQVVGLR